ncbi:MAG: tetratricopeptide repeat protein, partial [Methylocella sp.]
VEKYPDSELYVESLYGTAANFENAGDLKEALPLYEKLVRAHPEHALSKETLSRLGSLYVRAQDFEKAADFYQGILIDGKKDIAVTPDAAFWLIQYLLDKGKFENAQKALAVLQERFPNEDYRHETAYFMGEALLGMKDPPKAGDYYSQALALKPQGPYAPHALLGTGLARAAAGDAAGAEAKFNEALVFDDEPEVAARARFEIANLRLKAGDFAEAAKAYMLVAVLFDHPLYSAEALYQAGQCFAKAGQAEDSQKALMELKTRYPNSDWARKA